MELSPIMNLMCLPFALLVSAIAATTVFRRILVSPDKWSGITGGGGKIGGGRGGRNGDDSEVITGASLPRFAKVKRSQQTSTMGSSSTRSRSRGADHELSTMGGASNTLPPLSEWADEDEGLDADKQLREDTPTPEPAFLPSKRGRERGSERDPTSPSADTLITSTVSWSELHCLIVGGPNVQMRL
jgi:hypothetical protein